MRPILIGIAYRCLLSTLKAVPATLLLFAAVKWYPERPVTTLVSLLAAVLWIERNERH